MDEFGSPVDYRNSPAMVQELGGKAKVLESDKVRAAFEDAVPRFREMNDGYVADAAAAKASGLPTDKVALGYEAPIGEAQDNLYRKHREGASPAGPSASSETGSEPPSHQFAAPDRETEFARQQGHQGVVSAHTSAQFARFMKEEASGATEHPKRVVDTNAPWKSRML